MVGKRESTYAGKIAVLHCMSEVDTMSKFTPWHKIDWVNPGFLPDKTLLFRDDEGQYHIGSTEIKEDGEVYFYEDHELWDDD